MNITKKSFLFVLLFILALSSAFYLKSYTRSFDCLVMNHARYYDSSIHSYQDDKKILIRYATIADIVDMNTPSPDFGDCRVIDASHKFVFPGLIDAHTHLLAQDSQKVNGWKTALELSATRPEMMRIFIGEKNSHSMLLSGFTTVRDLGNSGYFLDEKLKALQTRDAFTGADLLYSGPGFAMLPTQINVKLNPSEYTVIDEKTDIDVLLKKYQQHNVEWIKLYADSPMGPALLKLVTEKAHQLNLKVAIHAENGPSIINALQAGPDSIEHFYEIPDIDPDVFIQKPTIVLTDYSYDTCQNLQFYPSCEKKMASLKNRIAWLQAKHFKLVFGSDAVLDFSSRFKSRGEASLASLISLKDLGLSNEELLFAATRAAGDLLQKNIGRVEKNFAADLVLFDEDPLLNLNSLKRRSLVLAKGELACMSPSECQP